LDCRGLAVEHRKPGSQTVSSRITRMRPNTYEAQHVKGTIIPWAAVRPPVRAMSESRGVLSRLSFPVGVRDRACTKHVLRFTTHLGMGRRSECFETWKLIGALMPAHSRVGLTAVAIASYLRARGRGRTRPLEFKDIAICRERDDHPIKARGYPGFGPVPGMWSWPQACWH